MPRSTRASARRALLEDNGVLLSVPVELLLVVARHLLTDDLPSALRLRQACAGLRQKLAPMRQEAEQRRLQWLPLRGGLSICEDGRTALQPNRHDTARPGVYPCTLWAMGELLPVGRKCRWTVRLLADPSEEFSGAINVGVCNAQGDCGIACAEARLALGLAVEIRSRTGLVDLALLLLTHWGPDVCSQVLRVDGHAVAPHAPPRRARRLAAAAWRTGRGRQRHAARRGGRRLAAHLLQSGGTAGQPARQDQRGHGGAHSGRRRAGWVETTAVPLTQGGRPLTGGAALRHLPAPRARTIGGLPLRLSPSQAHSS